MSEHLFDLFRLELLADLAPEYLLVPLVVALCATAYEVPVAVEGMGVGVVSGDVVHTEEHFGSAAAAVAAGEVVALEYFQFLLWGDRCLIHIILSIELKGFSIYER